MATDEPLEVENWVRERVLGSGGFGQVTLWRHKTKDEMIGEVQLNLCQTLRHTLHSLILNVHFAVTSSICNLILVLLKLSVRL
jgi:hypothetical protein